jgi:hypothetical protein
MQMWALVSVVKLQSDTAQTTPIPTVAQPIPDNYLVHSKIS